MNCIRLRRTSWDRENWWAYRIQRAMLPYTHHFLQKTSHTHTHTGVYVLHPPETSLCFSRCTDTLHDVSNGWDCRSTVESTVGVIQGVTSCEWLSSWCVFLRATTERIADPRSCVSSSDLPRPLLFLLSSPVLLRRLQLPRRQVFSSRSLFSSVPSVLPLSDGAITTNFLINRLPFDLLMKPVLLDVFSLVFPTQDWSEGCLLPTLELAWRPRGRLRR